MDWRKMTIAKALREASRHWTERDAILSRDQRLSFGELYDRACQLASGLAKIGSKGVTISPQFSGLSRNG